MNAKLVLRSATHQSRLSRSSGVSARELVEASLELIERLNPHLSAFVALCPGQMAEAYGSFLYEVERTRLLKPQDV